MRRLVWVTLVAGVMTSNGCYRSAPTEPLPQQTPSASQTPSTLQSPPALRTPPPGDVQDNLEDEYLVQRKAMVEQQLKLRDISDEKVLQAMLDVRRDEFVPEDYRDLAYSDQPLPIGHQQTISQPYIVALMTQLAQVKPEHTVLDVGTGSGYQAAVLAKISKQVYSIEIVEELADESRSRLQRLGYTNVEVRAGDGYAGWPEHAPFDAIIVAAAPDHVPPKLVEQLAPGARMVIPIGRRGEQQLMVVEKQADGSDKQWTVTPVAFVPMTGEAQNNKDK